MWLENGDSEYKCTRLGQWCVMYCTKKSKSLREKQWGCVVSVQYSHWSAAALVRNDLTCSEPARSRAISSSSVQRSGSAPMETRYATMEMSPRPEAMWRGEQPEYVRLFTSASHVSRRNWTFARELLSAARCSAVLPLLKSCIKREMMNNAELTPNPYTASTGISPHNIHKLNLARITSCCINLHHPKRKHDVYQPHPGM